MTFGEKVIEFYFNLRVNFDLPGNAGLINPFENTQTREVFKNFYRKYYDDSRPRHFIFGINPGRFGAGVTGISFTDPINLEHACGIVNPFQKKHELSSQFVYQVIQAYGGAGEFFSKFYFTALSPLGFIRDGKNLNYYDDPKLTEAISGFIRNCIIDQSKFGMNRDVSICLGEGKNYTYFSRVNEENQFFKKIEPLPHPRWVMQYRRKKAGAFVRRYVQLLKSIAEKD